MTARDGGSAERLADLTLRVQTLEALCRGQQLEPPAAPVPALAPAASSPPATALAEKPAEPAPQKSRSAAESLLLATPRVSTFDGQRALTGASGFFFKRDDRLYLVTSRHVLIDEPSHHHPDRIEIELHTDAMNLSRCVVLSLLLYENGQSRWRHASDSGGDIDVAVIEIDASGLDGVSPPAFTPAHLQHDLGEVEVGAPLLIVGFPLGFHDGLHHLPVVRQAAVASSFGIRFQGLGQFLTDGRTHRGTSGAPVVMRWAGPPSEHLDLPWKLLGVHSARMDMGGRDRVEDESLGLNCAWYADILLTLTTQPT